VKAKEAEYKECHKDQRGYDDDHECEEVDRGPDDYMSREYGSR